MAPEGIAAILQDPNQLCYFVCFFALFVTHFVHNVAATISYDRKKLLDIRTAILTSNWTKMFNEPDAKDILLCQDKAQIPVISVKKIRNYKGAEVWMWESVGE